MRGSWIRPLALGAAAAAAGPACGSTAEPKIHQVEIRGMEFVPAELAVSVGDKVVWTNRDVLPHTVTAAGRFDSGSMLAQQQWQYTVTKAGTVPYTCTFHPVMEGKLVAR